MEAGNWVAFLAGLAAAASVAAWIMPRKRVTPAERERRRRLTVSARGRVGSATITDFHDGVLSYTYTVGGVEHSATQDVSTLADLLPGNPATLISQPASLKYLRRNPANSIVLAEDWSGVRFRRVSGAAESIRGASAGGAANGAE
ncbi:MAG: hypothetical protein ABSE56_03010 [Bryobacteraceae bacterium]|jgi:hypothetical protein